MSSASNGNGKRLWIGLGRADITACVEGMSMWGWGSEANVAKGVAMPLMARAVALSEGREAPPVVVCTVELGMVSEALRVESLSRLRALGVVIDEERFAISANHTHSGPSGFSTYLWYSLSGPGFSPLLLTRLAEGVALAVRTAIASLAPGNVRVAEGDVPLTHPVAWNRSLTAYNKNLDVSPVRPERADEALDRRMRVLRFEDEHGQARGLLALFAVHGTSIHADSEWLHPDNAGVAAAEVEHHAEREGRSDFVALFALGAAGDVSPNYRVCPIRRQMIGRYDDDFESAAWNGGIQAREAIRLCDRAALSPALETKLRCVLRFRSIPTTHIDADLLPKDARSERAASPCLGFGFTLGTVEGPGPLGRSPAIFSRVRALATSLGTVDPEHFPKPVLVELGAGIEERIGRRITPSKLARLGASDRRLRYFTSVAESPAVRELPWVPEVLPFQVLRIGSFALAFLPFEPTTVAGRRTKAVLDRELARAGVETCAVVGYANAYCSYLTTPEEYDVQAYEGASTLFGRNALAAVTSIVRALACSIATDHVCVLANDALSTRPFEERLPSADDFYGRHAAGLHAARLPRVVPRSRGLASSL